MMIVSYARFWIQFSIVLISISILVWLAWRYEEKHYCRLCHTKRVDQGFENSMKLVCPNKDCINSPLNINYTNGKL